tara:strand:+ start:883 stop:1341 length:459 start_codon:yes stop_codon:yes gene_type:complete
MNLSELQAFLEDSNWDDEPEPAHPLDAPKAAVMAKRAPKERAAQPVVSEEPVSAADLSEPADPIPTLIVEADLQIPAPRAPVKLVPRVKEDPSQEEPELRVTESVRERLLEVEMAQKMGYLLCKCSWPPQIMVLTGTDHVYRCRRCSRVREM